MSESSDSGAWMTSWGRYDLEESDGSKGMEEARSCYGRERRMAEVCLLNRESFEVGGE